MKVMCWNEECKYCLNGHCSLNELTIDEGCECECFESYFDDPEWQVPFWKRMIDRDNNRLCRVQFRGKEFKVKGRKFFVENRSDYALVTDAKTGLGCGTVAALEDRIDRIIEIGDKVEPLLESLPIATYDEETRKFTYESESAEETEGEGNE